MRCEGDHGGKYWCKKVRQPWKQGNTAESHVGGGAITIASLSPHTSTALAAEQLDRLAHQTPDALNYRVGPHPGCPFKCLMHQTME